MSSFNVWDPENTTKEGKVKEMQWIDGIACLKMKRGRFWMQITKGAVMKLYAGEELILLLKSFNDALSKCSQQQVKEQIEEWKSQAEKEKKGGSAKREQVFGDDEGDGQEAKKKVAKETTGVAAQAEQLLGDHQEEDDVIKEKADKKKSGKKKTIVSGKREQLVGDIEGDEVKKKKKKKARKLQAKVVGDAEDEDEDEDEDYDDDVDKQESSKKGRKEKNVQTATVRKTRKAERDAEAQEETAKEAQLVERLKVRENVFVDPNEIAVNGITDEGQRKNACTMFLRRYRAYREKEKFVGKISNYVELAIAECDDVNPIYRKTDSVMVKKIADRKVIFMDGIKISGEENFKLEETSEWFLVETEDESKMWMRISQIKNLFDVLPDFFSEKLDFFNSILKNYFGQMEVKLKLVSKLAPALNGPQDVESRRRGDTHFCFMGPPGTGKTTVAELFALGSWLLVESRYGHLVRIEGAGAKAHCVGHTMPKVERLFKAAKGGTLFFDEAYAICSGKEDQYGLEALAAICAKTEPSQMGGTNFLVAGYAFSLEDSFFGNNPGLKSRFVYFDFVQYSPDELLNVFVQNAVADRFKLDGDASEFLKSVLVRGDCQENQCRSMGNLFRDFKDRWSVNRGKTDASSKERRFVSLNLIKESVSKIIELEAADRQKRVESEAKLAKMKIQKGGWKDDAVNAFKVSKSGSKSNVATSEKNVVDSLREEKQTKKKLKFVVVSDEEEVVIVDEKEEEKEKKVEEEEEKKGAKKKVKKKPLVANDLLSFTEAEEYQIITGARRDDSPVIKSLKTFQFEDGEFYFLLSDFKNINGTERPPIYSHSIRQETVDERRTVTANSPLGKVLKKHGISLKGGANFIRVNASSLMGKVVKR